MKVFFCIFFFLIPLFLVQSQRIVRSQEAQQAFREGRFEDAARISLAEININPGNLESSVILCRSLIHLERYEESKTFALAGRSISRYDPRLIEILGEVYFFQGRNYESLQYFQEYINLAPQGGRIDIVYYYIGEIFIRERHFRRADIALSTAVYYAPQNSGWWARLAYAREYAGELHPALVAYEKALSLNEDLMDARRGMARILARLTN